MIYKVIGKRPVYQGSKLLLESRIEFEEESELSPNDFWLQILEEFPHWIINYKEVKRAKHG